jgi:hypothetical protein
MKEITFEQQIVAAIHGNISSQENVDLFRKEISDFFEDCLSWGLYSRSDCKGRIYAAIYEDSCSESLKYDVRQTWSKKRLSDFLERVVPKILNGLNIHL